MNTLNCFNAVTWLASWNSDPRDKIRVMHAPRMLCAPLMTTPPRLQDHSLRTISEEIRTAQGTQRRGKWVHTSSQVPSLNVYKLSVNLSSSSLLLHTTNQSSIYHSSTKPAIPNHSNTTTKPHKQSSCRQSRDPRRLITLSQERSLRRSQIGRAHV